MKVKPSMSRYKQQWGSATVEMAIILPLLLLLVFGIAEFGIALYRQEVLTNASREGARAGIVLSTPAVTTAQIQNAVTNYLTSAGWNAALATVTATGAGGAFGTPVTVTVTYDTPFSVLSGLVPGIPATKTLTAQTVMRHE
jgi:Flp pilus assembly protein TadG